MALFRNVAVYCGFLCQRLTGEVERLRTDKDVLEQQVESQSVDTSITQRPEQEWMAMASKLRVNYPAII